MKIAPDSETICLRCHKDKGQIKLFSTQNNMDPKHLPAPLTDLSMIEQQLICKISQCAHVETRWYRIQWSLCDFPSRDQ